MEYNFDEGDNITITADFIEYLDQLKRENKGQKQIIDKTGAYVVGLIINNKKLMYRFKEYAKLLKIQNNEYEQICKFLKNEE